MVNRKLVVIIAALFVILIIGGLALQSRLNRGVEEQRITPTPSEILPTIDPSVKVNLTATSDRRAVILTIDNFPPDITSIDYELTYNTGEGLPRGVLGSIKVKETDKIERKIILGTCSKNTCSYDEGVEKVLLVLKFNSPQGSSQFKKEYPI